jgi:regulator of sigma E protease
MSYVLSIVVLAVLILVHEFGHMWVARLCGMRVDKFSIFFGPALFRWRGKHTTYQIASVPLGGYVQIAGMNPHENLPPDDSGSYQNKPVWQRFATVLAGPSINYLFAILIMVVVIVGWGVPRPSIEVGQVVDGSPARAAGMRAGDQIQAIDGQQVRTREEVVAAIQQSEGRTLRLGVRRQGEPVAVDVTPREQDGNYRIGIQFSQKPGFFRVGLGTALWASLRYPWLQSANVLSFLGRLITREVSAVDNVGGPVAIVQWLKESFDVGLAVVLLQAAMLNVYLGLFNLLPLPALDGGRLVFLLAEGVTRKKVNQRAETLVHASGFVLLMGLLLLVTYSDIRRFFGG